MSTELLLWITSLAGATLFFAAGSLLAGRRRVAAPAGAAPAQPTAPETERLRQELASARQEAERSTGHLREERKRAHQAAAERELLEARAGKATTLEAELEERRTEIHQWRERLADTEARLATAVHPETELTLRQDLAIRSQQLDASQRRVKVLEEENATLRQELAATGGLQAERDHLTAENAELRAREFAVRRPTGSRPVTLAGGGLTPGGVLQTLVEKVSRLGDIRCAVIADDLGLVVASHGELSEEVAAVGALFARAGLQAQKVLPLRNVQRITIEDDQNVVLNLRPLRTDGVKDVELALITLAVGASPDPRLVNKLIDEGPRSGLSS
jgi:hypothetical protein